ncbi:MAG: pyridoxal phosphate-dependent aminotransferase [Gammaproteobacteria bacterium]
MQPESKLPQIGTTIFTVMSSLAERHGAINLSQGFPDFEPPAKLVEAVTRHMLEGRNQYPPMMGIAPLRERIADKALLLYGVEVNPDTEVTISSGATEALLCSIHALVRPGDEVIVFDPAYDSYEPAILLAGGSVVHVPLTPGLFRIDFEQLAARLSSATRLVIINTPHNPTGSLLYQDDLDRLATLLAPYQQCYVLSDEVYEHICFDPSGHASVIATEGLKQRSMAVFSFGKTYHATGWKVGYCIAPPALTTEFRRVHQFNTFTTATPLQWALADYMASDPQHYLELPDFYRHKRDFFRNLLQESGFELLPCEGTYFQLADYSSLSDLDDVAFSRWLTERHKVAVIPISVFCEQQPDARWVRFCFAKQEATLEEAADRLCRI